MNLVIDDAVEVKQATKANPEEKRRPLGMNAPAARLGSFMLIISTFRSNSTKRRQRVPDTKSFGLRGLYRQKICVILLRYGAKLHNGITGAGRQIGVDDLINTINKIFWTIVHIILRREGEAIRQPHLKISEPGLSLPCRGLLYIIKEYQVSLYSSNNVVNAKTRQESRICISLGESRTLRHGSKVFHLMTQHHLCLPLPRQMPREL